APSLLITLIRCRAGKPRNFFRAAASKEVHRLNFYGGLCLMSSPRWLLVVAVIALLGLLIMSPGVFPAHPPVAAQTGGDVRTVTVTGHAVTSQAPDMATIHVGVVSQAGTATEAREQNAAAMEQLRSGLQRAGVAAGD